MNRQLFYIVALLAIALGLVSAQDPTTEDPPTEVPPGTTANPGLPYGSVCNGFLARCNRYSETVACVQRRKAPTTTTEGVPPTTESPITEDPVASLFLRKNVEEEPDICETGITVDLGKCQCKRNCKNGQYVEDGEFDAEREICVGLAGSTCSGLVPNCTKNATCNFLTSKCVCQSGFVDDGTGRCVPV